jgi:phospholysine phosphohistidine inorganic pyrophosphate phosphatase
VSSLPLHNATATIRIPNFTEIVEEFEGINQNDPNCVVIGDAEEDFTFERLNTAFRILIASERPLLITLGTGKFYQRVDGPCLDVGTFAKALEYASNCAVINCGKPNKEFFMHGLNDLGLSSDEVVMIGDDIEVDVKGAKECGFRAVQVKTGKYRKEIIEHSGVIPNLLASNLHDAVTFILDGQYLINT